MNKIAVTGADGFIGGVVTKRLQNQNVKLKLFDTKKYNLLESDSLKNFVKDQDVIIHLAGVNRGTNEDLLRINTLGTLSLLDALTKYSPKTRVIFASTFQVYLPNSLYGLSKKFAEELLMQYALNYKIKSVTLRLSNVYGPGGKPFYNSVIATFTHLIKNDESIKINGDGSQKRDFIYVDDVASAFVKAALKDFAKPFEIIDICSGKEVTLNKVLKNLKLASGKNFQIMYNKAAQEKPWPTSGKNFKIAKSLLNWEPATSLKDGLTDTVNYG